MELLTLLREASQRGWMRPYRSELPDVYSDYIGFEDEARSIANYESLFVPGLLQTEAYARAQLRGTLPYASEAEIESRVAARLERQPVLVKDDAPKLWAIMDEAALRRPAPGPRRQDQHRHDHRSPVTPPRPQVGRQQHVRPPA